MPYMGIVEDDSIPQTLPPKEKINDTGQYFWLHSERSLSSAIAQWMGNSWYVIGEIGPVSPMKFGCVDGNCLQLPSDLTVTIWTIKMDESVIISTEGFSYTMKGTIGASLLSIKATKEITIPINLSFEYNPSTQIYNVVSSSNGPINEKLIELELVLTKMCNLQGE